MPPLPVHANFTGVRIKVEVTANDHAGIVEVISLDSVDLSDLIDRVRRGDPVLSYGVPHSSESSDLDVKESVTIPALELLGPPLPRVTRQHTRQALLLLSPTDRLVHGDWIVIDPEVIA